MGLKKRAALSYYGWILKIRRNRATAMEIGPALSITGKEEESRVNLARIVAGLKGENLQKHECPRGAPLARRRAG